MQAFDIARSLGIACTLTPNMMVTATVPDKLAVMSFVYQMYQYFNKATQSAITRQSSRTLGSGTNSPTGEVIFIHEWLCIHIRTSWKSANLYIWCGLKTISTCMLNHSTAHKFLVVSCQSITCTSIQILHHSQPFFNFTVLRCLHAYHYRWRE